MFVWPIITKEDEEIVLDVLHRRAMSGTDITMQFEKNLLNGRVQRHWLAVAVLRPYILLCLHAK